MLVFDCAELQSNVDESSVFFNLICSCMCKKVHVNPWPNDYHRQEVCRNYCACLCDSRDLGPNLAYRCA